MDFIKRTLLVCGGFASVQVAFAQKATNDSVLNRTVVVENQYNPEVADAFKINVLPEVEEPETAKQEIDYAVSSRPLHEWEVRPMAVMLPAVSQKLTSRGYARASYGSMGNVDMKGSYLWNMSGRDCIGIMASMYGRNGDLSHMTAPEDWKSRFYRTDVSLDYRHDFHRVSLYLGGSFASQVFNYMPSLEGSGASNTAETDRQHYTLGEGFVKVASNGKKLPVEFAVQTGFKSFHRKYGGYAMQSGSEGIIHTSGYLSGDINQAQQVGVRLQMDNLIHDASLQQKDFTLLQFNPYYTLKNGQLVLRAGAFMSLQTANDGGLRVAPDVALDYTFASSYTLFLHLAGGTSLNDFRRLNDVSPYWMQYGGQLRTSYTPIDASVGLKASPVADVSFKLQGGYRITKNEMFVLPDIGDDSSLLYASLMQEKTKVTYVGASVSYAYLDWADFTLSGNYCAWDVPEGMDELLLLKPQFAVDFSVRGKVFDNLHAVLDYRYEGRKDIAGGLRKANPVNDLCVGAEYELFKRINVFARLNNLLNKDYLTESGYPEQGLYFMAGLSCRF